MEHRRLIFVQCEDREVISTTHGPYQGLLGRMLGALTNCQSARSLEGRDSASNPPASVPTGNLDKSVKAELGSNFPKFLEMDASLYSPWLEVSTMSLPNMILASYWLQSCKMKHKVWTDYEKAGSLPNRIINISDPTNPVLDEGLNREEQYVTLSYMWGETHRYVTTTQNLDRHTKYGIPLKELPKTFEDAIFVASFLGFRWIWIDALCICQDRPDELAQEVGKMDETFRTSTLTIFATAGESADTGLMSMRDPRWVKPCKLTIKTTLGDRAAEGSAYFTLDRGEDTKSPLYNRGWVLQEQVLSHRGLIFESRQIRWRCLCGTASETFPSRTSDRTIDAIEDTGTLHYDRYVSYPKGHDGFNYMRMWIRHKDAMPSRTPWQRDNQYDAWYSMVTDYNVRALTYETDVLSALAGLASAMVTTHGCTYLAGLWKEDLQTGLCWYVSGSKYNSIDMLVADSGKSPSWSWISQRCREIRFCGWENNHYVIKHEGLIPMDNTSNTITNTRAEISAALSSVVSRELTVSGRLRKIAVDEALRWGFEKPDSRNSGPPSARWVRRVRDIATDEMIGHIAFDFDPGNLSACHVYCLLCIAREKYGEWHLTCLGLAPSDESLVEFQRIGLVVVTKKDWFGELQMFDVNDRGDSRCGRKETPFYKTIRLI